MADKTKPATYLLATIFVLSAVACSDPAAAPGEPGTASEVDRVVEIEATNELRFDPSEIDAEVGETIEFKITNAASSEHEFVLGSSADEHSEDMHHTETNATGTIEPGASASVIWRFTASGEVQFACHIAGHDKQGMTGTISVSG